MKKKRKLILVDSLLTLIKNINDVISWNRILLFIDNLFLKRLLHKNL